MVVHRNYLWCSTQFRGDGNLKISRQIFSESLEIYWKAINTEHKQIVTDCNNVKRVFKIVLNLLEVKQPILGGVLFNWKFAKNVLFSHNISFTPLNVVLTLHPNTCSVVWLSTTYCYTPRVCHKSQFLMTCMYVFNHGNIEIDVLLV